MDDQAILNSCPEQISIGGLLKATPQSEGDRRYLYLEASNEDLDHQNEIILQKALTDSAEYFLRHGNLDISHYTMIGLKQGIPNFMDYEIGKPIDVRVDGASTFVKCELYRGESSMAKSASMVWDSMTAQTPPARWYPSVGGAVLAKSVQVDPETQRKVAVVEKVRWNNLALDRTPVNRTVSEASRMPIGVFAKSLNAFVVKGLTAGYGADVATLEGGAALRKQSLAGAVYAERREHVASHLRAGRMGKSPTSQVIKEYCIKNFGLTHDESSELVDQFMCDLNVGLTKRRSSHV